MLSNIFRTHPSRPSRPLSRLLVRLPLAIVLIVSALAITVPVALNRTPVAQAASPLPANDADFKPDVIYQVMIDRFFDGNTSNNDPSGDTGLYDSTKANWKLYWGGDLAGLTQKISYLANAGELLRKN